MSAADNVPTPGVMGPEPSQVCEVVNSVLEEMRLRPASAGDAGYIAHAARFERTVTRLSQLLPAGARVLDVGSHFLHHAACLSLLGFRVSGLDVSPFADLPVVRERARRYGIDNRAIERLDRGEFFPDESNAFDAVVFTEILEHVTFNPVLMWRRIYDLVKAPGGFVFITTPNSLTPWKVASAIKRMSLRRGFGIAPEEILSTVTYGHHWKEYSAWEIRRLFELLSPDWNVRIAYYGFTDEVSATASGDFKARIRRLTNRVFPALFESARGEIEVIARLEARTSFIATDPGY